jgi:hypothetical protein
MSLTYLFETFQEESAFAAAHGTDPARLAGLIAQRLFPAPSYTLAYAPDGGGRITSYFGTHADTASYRFHLKAHGRWLADIVRFGLDGEAQVEAFFRARYIAARDAFFAGALGRKLAAAMPDVAAGFDDGQIAASWRHFLDGTFGVCTRDGQPETIFLKEACASFVERMADGPGGAGYADILVPTVDLLDRVLSPFAPHEVERSSRQRWVNDMRAQLPGPQPG